MSDHDTGERVMRAHVNRLESPAQASGAAELALIAGLIALAIVVALIGAAEPIAGLIAFAFGVGPM